MWPTRQATCGYVRSKSEQTIFYSCASLYEVLFTVSAHAKKTMRLATRGRVLIYDGNERCCVAPNSPPRWNIVSVFVAIVTTLDAPGIGYVFFPPKYLCCAQHSEGFFSFSWLRVCSPESTHTLEYTDNIYKD
eukprot:GEMP01070944.1.p1 GENE.GEMP01070944.1~~GEMP01070944.1.p1  ORF type:complete len:133 (-),score=3.43 GEMP01070944.1:683-1081(-)